MKQFTLNTPCSFEGKGLHTGKFSHMRVLPASEDNGIVFVRTDLSAKIPALAQYVSNTARSTTLTCEGASVVTIEHIMSALTGLGIDNAIVELDNEEVPILDGSARIYAEAFLKAGLKQQNAERHLIELEEPVEVGDAESGSYIKMTPSDTLSIEVTVDFNSRVLGVQKASWSLGEDYAGQVAPCRTFCFFHELEMLASMGLVKGGDVDNAIVVVEKPVTQDQVSAMARFFGQPNLSVTSDGYLSNLALNFKDECGRHKLLDLIGDIRLVGGFPKARIQAYKPGHGINTTLAVKAQKKN